PEPRVDVTVVVDVVPAVGERRRVEGAEPDRVDAEPLQGGHALGDAGQVAEAVADRVRDGARVDLVDGGLPPPRGVARAAVRGQAGVHHFGHGVIGLLARFQACGTAARGFT